MNGADEKEILVSPSLYSSSSCSVFAWNVSAKPTEKEIDRRADAEGEEEKSERRCEKKRLRREIDREEDTRKQGAILIGEEKERECLIAFVGDVSQRQHPTVTVLSIYDRRSSS